MRSVFLFLLIAPALAIAQQQQRYGTDTILQRLTTIYMTGNTHLPVNDSIPVLLTTIQPNGSWTKFNYTEKPKVDLPSIEHVSRLVKMAVAYKSKNSIYYKNDSLVRAIHNGLAFWIKAKPESRNWWYGKIGIPNEVAKVLVLMQDELTADEKKDGIDILKRANVNGVLIAGSTRATGQNMIWVATLQMQAACLESDAAYLQFSVENMIGEMKVSTGEGMQPDHSFHQHGPQLYAGGYGLAFAVDCSRIAYLLRNTAFALPDTIINNLSNYILMGQQWMIWNGKIDYSTIGREIARVGKSATSVAVACHNMAALNTRRKPEFEALAKSIETNGNSGNYLSGNRHFPNSDFMVHRRKNYYTSVKMNSVRTVASESGNGEAEQNFHMGNGNMFVLRSDKEYEDIFPLWDWQKIPGVTNRVRTNEALPLITFGSGARGHTRFAGGVSDSLYGAAAFDLNRDSVTGKKSWFFFDNEIVCLGAGLNVQMDEPFTTGINQCFAKGNVVYQANDRENTLSEKTMTGPVKWVYHDSTAYFFEGSSQVQMQEEEKKASWAVINRTMADPPVQTGSVFSLWLNHDKAENQQYAYTIVPAIDLLKCRQYKPEKQYHILSNTTALQAVQQLQLSVVQVVFWKAGKLRTKGLGEIIVDKPCMLMLRKNEQQITVSVSDPSGENEVINVEHLTSTKASKLVFHLPSGVMAGYTISQAIKKG